MAKTKEQKQVDAIERKRASFSKNFDQYIRFQHGMPAYSELEQSLGQAKAQARADETRKTFERYCNEAKIDKHGNHLQD